VHQLELDAAEGVLVECEHWVLIRDVAGLSPPNDRFYEGDVAAPPGGALGDTGARSVGDAAVAALVTLGVSPSLRFNPNDVDTSRFMRIRSVP